MQARVLDRSMRYLTTVAPDSPGMNSKATTCYFPSRTDENRKKTRNEISEVCAHSTLYRYCTRPKVEKRWGKSEHFQARNIHRNTTKTEKNENRKFEPTSLSLHDTSRKRERGFRQLEPGISSLDDEIKKEMVEFLHPHPLRGRDPVFSVLAS